jgi:hypothetical protein
MSSPGPQEGRMTSTVAKKPVAAPAAATAGIIASLAVIAAGAVGIRDTLVSVGALDGRSWLEWLFDKAEVLKPVDWMIPAGIGAVLIGLWFLFAALKPRKRTHKPVGDAGVWIRNRDVVRVTTSAVEDH